MSIKSLSRGLRSASFYLVHSIYSPGQLCPDNVCQTPSLLSSPPPPLLHPDGELERENSTEGLLLL